MALAAELSGESVVLRRARMKKIWQLQAYWRGQVT